jgi:hypothetical protein
MSEDKLTLVVKVVDRVASIQDTMQHCSVQLNRKNTKMYIFGSGTL